MYRKRASRHPSLRVDDAFDDLGKELIHAPDMRKAGSRPIGFIQLVAEACPKVEMPAQHFAPATKRIGHYPPIEPLITGESRGKN